MKRRKRNWPRCWIEKYYGEQTGLFIKVLAVGLMLSAIGWGVSFREMELTEEFFLPRHDSLYQKELVLYADGEEAGELTVPVEVKRLSKEESRALLEEIKGQMETYILGDNLSLEEVRSDLNLISEIEGTQVKAEWELDSYEVLNLDGSIRSRNLKEEGTLVELKARLTCNGEDVIYRACARVLPPLLSPEESFRQEVDELLAQMQEKSSESAYRELPREAQGKTLRWKEKRQSLAGGLLFLTILSLVLLYVAKEYEQKQQIKERERQMSRDYAQVVSKLVLLMRAGMTIRNAWELMVQDYQRKKETGRCSVRYVYEEMALSCREIQNGAAEAKAYENFGIRCRLPCYLKLSALLEQNLKKGNKGLTDLLQMEVREAFEQRKDLARSRGEETSSKLLVPMILMFSVVLILILAPAGMSMKVQ